MSELRLLEFGFTFSGIMKTRSLPEDLLPLAHTIPSISQQIVKPMLCGISWPG